MTKLWLLDVLHCHERTIVVAGGLYRSRYHSGKSFAKFGILCHQRLDHGHIFLKRPRGIRYIGGLIIYFHIKLVSCGQQKDFRQMIDLAARAYIHGVSVRRHIGWLRWLALCLEWVV